MALNPFTIDSIISHYFLPSDLTLFFSHQPLAALHFLVLFWTLRTTKKLLGFQQSHYIVVDGKQLELQIVFK